MKDTGPSIKDRVKKGLKNPINTLRTIIYILFRAVGHSGFKRFIVLARGRTGSNLLISFLNGHPKIVARGEILRLLHARDQRVVLGQVFFKEPYYIKAKGFKIFYTHPLDDDSGKVWELLQNLDDLRVIHLKRRNTRIAGNQDVWQVRSAKSPVTDKDKSVAFTVGELEERFRQTRQWERDGDQMFKGHSMVSVYYEDLVSDPEEAFGKITDWLGVFRMKPTTDLRKQNPEPLRELVRNYDELKSVFSGTEWESMFDE